MLPPFDELTVTNSDPGDALKRGCLASGGKSQSLAGVLSGGGPPDNDVVTVCQDGIESDMEFRECGEQRLVLADPKFFGAAHRAVIHVADTFGVEDLVQGLRF